MRPRTDFVLALHGECLHSNTYKNAFICFEKIFLGLRIAPHILICSNACQPMILSIKLASDTLFMLVKFCKFSKPVTLLKCT